MKDYVTPFLAGAVTQAQAISHATPLPAHSIDHLTQGGKPQQQPQQQPLAFTFPTPEEVALQQQQQQQRLLSLIHSGAVPVGTEPFPGAAIFQSGGLYHAAAAAHLYPALAAHPLTIEAFSHLRPEEQATLLAAQQQQQQAQGGIHQFMPGIVPPILMEQLIAQQQQQQQQQQQAALVVAGSAAGGMTATPNMVPATPAENVMEIQRHYELLLHSIQRNPIIAQSPQVKMAMEQYQRILQEHHMQQQQRFVQEVLSQHQHEMHKQLFLARVPASEDSSSTRGIRTGVIVHPN